MPARFTRENEVVYCGDTRYPGPAYYPAPPEIKGTPSQAELDAHPRLFTWGELKEIIREFDKARSAEEEWARCSWHQLVLETQPESWGAREGMSSCNGLKLRRRDLGLQ